MYLLPPIKHHYHHDHIFPHDYHCHRTTTIIMLIMIITNAKTESKTPPCAFLIARIAPVKEKKISFDLIDLACPE